VASNDFLNQFIQQVAPGSMVPQNIFQRDIAAGQVTPGGIVDRTMAQLPGSVQPVMGTVRPTTGAFDQFLAQTSNQPKAIGPGTAATNPGVSLAEIKPNWQSTLNNPQSMAAQADNALAAGPKAPLALGTGTDLQGVAAGPAAPGKLGASIEMKALNAAESAPIHPADTPINTVAKDAVDNPTAKVVAQDGSVVEASKLAQFSTKLNDILPGFSNGEAGLTVDMTAGSLMAGAGVAYAGLALGGFVDNLNIGGQDSNWDKGISGGVKGAGLGLGGAIALGLTGGPLGLALAAGAGLFMAGGIISNMSNTRNVNNEVDRAHGFIKSILDNNTFGVDDYTKQQVNMMVETNISALKSTHDWAGLGAYVKSLASTVPSYLMQASERQKVLKTKMQLQAAYGGVYSHMLDQASAANQMAYGVQQNAANTVTDPSLRAGLQSAAAGTYAANQNLQAAYAQQVAGSAQNINPDPNIQSSIDQANQMAQQSMNQQHP
jgi:hypothetical protein